MPRPAGAHLRHGAEQRGSGDFVEDQHVAPDRDLERGGLAGVRGEGAELRSGGRAQIAGAGGAGAQHDGFGAETIVLASCVTDHHTLALQGREQPVGGRLVEMGRAGEVRQPPFPPGVGKHFEKRNRARHGLRAGDVPGGDHVVIPGFMMRDKRIAPVEPVKVARAALVGVQIPVNRAIS